MISCDIPKHLYTIKHNVAVYMLRMGGCHNFYDVVLNDELKSWLDSKGDYKVMQVSRANPITECFERIAKIIFVSEETAMEFRLIWL